MKIAIYSQHAGKYTNSILFDLFDLSNNYSLDFFIEKGFNNLLIKDSNLKFEYKTFFISQRFR